MAAKPLDVYAGQQVTTLATFVNAAVPAVLTDPTGATLTYRDAAGLTAPVIVLLAGMTHVSTGLYTLAIDTTNFVTGLWDFQILSTGAVASFSLGQINILARPLG